MPIASAYPYVNVSIRSSLQPTAQRAIGNVALVGATGGHGSLGPNAPTMISDFADAQTKLASVDSAGAVTGSGALYQAVGAALLQDPAPARIYAVATDGGDVAAALATLSALQVNFVVLAGITDVGASGPPATGLTALKEHCESLSADGRGRIGVAMVDPALSVASDSSYADTVSSTYGGLQSGDSRMILVAGRDVDGDLAAAVAGAIAGYDVHISTLLKPVRGITIPVAAQFTPSELKALTEANVMPVFDPELITGAGLHLASGRTYTTDTSRLYVDLVRTIDDVDFRLKAGLIGAIGNVRIDRLGMQNLEGRINAILSPLKRRRVIDDYRIFIPLLPILAREESERTADESTRVSNARIDRTVEVMIDVYYGPAIHTLNVQVALKA